MMQYNLENPLEWKWWNQRVRYLLDCQPEVTWQTFRENRQDLYDQIVEKVEQAADYEVSLNEQGNLAPDQVWELVSNLVYPRDIPEREPLPEDQEGEILVWAENPPENRKYMRKIKTM